MNAHSIGEHQRALAWLLQADRLTFALLCSVGAVVGVALITTSAFPHLWHGAQDFSGFYLGAKTVGTPSLYDVPTGVRLQAEYTGDGNVGMLFMYVRLPIYAALIRPIATLPYDTALIVWKIGMAVFFVVATAVIANCGRLAVLAMCWSLPAAIMLQWGQDASLPFLCVAAWLRLANAERGVLGLCCLAIAAIVKPHLFLPVFVASLAAGRVRTAGVMVGGVLFALVVSTVVQGSGWLTQYRALLAGDLQSSITSRMPTIAAISNLRPADAPWLYAIVAIAGCLLAIMTARRVSFPVAAAAAVAIGVVTSHHSYPYDCLYFIPLAVLTLSQMPALRFASTTLLFPAAYIPLHYSVPHWGPLFAVLPVILVVLHIATRTADTDAVATHKLRQQ